jgi:drug/metabolite transporter (DMT)-like permease
MLGSLAWACGSILSRRSKLSVDSFTATGWEMTLAGLTNLVIAVGVGDFHKVVWARSGLLATGYLIVFGSWVGFTAFIWLLEHVPTPKVATYAYVNPVIAVVLGFFLLHERLDRFAILGMFTIVIAVALVTSSKLKSGSPVANRNLAGLESEA